MTPDRHLGSAWLDRCRPDVFITESTYATTIRDSKRIREREFLKKVHTAVARGGKVCVWCNSTTSCFYGYQMKTHNGPFVH